MRLFRYNSIKFKVFCLLMTVMLVLPLFTGCNETSIFDDNEGQEGAYTLSDKISFSSSILRSINPVNSIDADFYQIGRLVYDSLIQLDDTLIPQPSLAKSYSFDQAAGTITFDLDTSVKFSDGSDFDADDVVFSFNAYKAATSAYSDSIAKIAKVEKKSASSVTFTFSDRTRMNAAYFDFPILSSGQFSSSSALAAATDEILVGTGIYKIDSADLSKSLVLTANPQYRGSKAENTITIDIEPTESPYIGYVKTGAISMIVSKDTDREDLSGDKEINVTTFTSNSVETIGFNCASGPFTSLNMRKAVASMIDIDSIIAAAYYNSGTKSDDLYFPGYYGTETVGIYGADETSAREYLSVAGYGDTDGDGLLEDSEGNKLTISLYVNEGNLYRTTAAELIASKLRDQGISVNLQKIGDEGYYSVLASGAYDMFIGGWTISSDYDLRPMYHSGYGNIVGYSNVKLDACLDRLQSGLGHDEYKEALLDARKIMDSEIPYLCLVFKTYAAATSPDMEGLVAPRYNNYYYACSDWKMRIYEEDGDN